MGPTAELDFEPLGDAVLAHLWGEVDLANARSVRDRLLEAVPNTATGLVLDLTATHHLDSSGVRVLFELAERLENRRQKLEIVVPDEAPVRRVLLLTEIDRVVPLFSSVGALPRP
jgi:stage II sporulation protein AA (anti-sigma F factor antagonist)